jgi:hypothetical protein
MAIYIRLAWAVSLYREEITWAKKRGDKKRSVNSMIKNNYSDPVFIIGK